MYIRIFKSVMDERQFIQVIGLHSDLILIAFLFYSSVKLTQYFCKNILQDFESFIAGFTTSLYRYFLSIYWKIINADVSHALLESDAKSIVNLKGCQFF